MNKGYALFATAVLLSACGNSYKPTYTPAAKGTTTGTATSQMIDSTGGTVTSADGRLSVTVPAGMFTTAMQIGIQPITNTSPNGVGNAYRLTPEGSMFTQDVTITFHLNSVEALGLDSTFVDTQHADGLWYSQPKQARDSTAATVSVPARHFSDWAIATTVLLKPQETRVKATQKASFTATVIIIHDLDEDEELATPGADEVAVPGESNLSNQINGTHSWEVNGAPGGTDSFGHVADANMAGNYTAPNSPPNPSEVTVSITVQAGKTKVVAPAKATIYAQEVWNGDSHVTLTDGTVIDSTFTFTQVSDDGHGKLSFNVSSGHVHAMVPYTLPSGCTQTATPTDENIDTNEGTMTATYDLSTGPDDPMVAGMGTTVWLANYTTMCPNGNGTMQAAIQAQWWPVMLGSAPTPVEAVGGVYSNTISAFGTTGTVHLTRQ
jgi:hypothetical protein